MLKRVSGSPKGFIKQGLERNNNFFSAEKKVFFFFENACNVDIFYIFFIKCCLFYFFQSLKRLKNLSADNIVTKLSRFQKLFP